MSPQPSERDLSDIRADATKWQATSSIMGNAQTAVNGEANLTDAFGFIGEGEGTDKEYANVQTFLATVAGQGKAEFAYGANALHTVIRVYQGAEKDAGDAVKKAWHV